MKKYIITLGILFGLFFNSISFSLNNNVQGYKNNEDIRKTNVFNYYNKKTTDLIYIIIKNFLIKNIKENNNIKSFKESKKINKIHIKLEKIKKRITNKKKKSLISFIDILLYKNADYIYKDILNIYGINNKGKNEKRNNEENKEIEEKEILNKNFILNNFIDENNNLLYYGGDYYGGDNYKKINSEKIKIISDYYNKVYYSHYYNNNIKIFNKKEFNKFSKLMNNINYKDYLEYTYNNAQFVFSPYLPIYILGHSSISPFLKNNFWINIGHKITLNILDFVKKEKIDFGKSRYFK